MEEKRVDLRIPHPEDVENGKRQAQLVFKLNHTMPMTAEYAAVLHELFEDRIGEDSMIASPIQVICADQITIGGRRPTG